MKMMKISQTKALIEAHAQPSASSSPKTARRRGTDLPAPIACWVIVLHPHRPADPAGATSFGGERSGHVRVHVADERIGPGLERRDVIVLGGHAGEDLALEDRGTC